MDSPILADNPVELGESVAHHLRNVLRATTATPLILFDGSGGEWEARLSELDRKHAIALPGTFIDVNRQPALQITLAQCIARNERMDYSLQKSTELGVSIIQPLWVTGQKQLKAEPLQRRAEHWQRVIRSAAEQSGRTTLPTLLPPISLQEWQPESCPAETRLCLSPDATSGLSDLKSAGLFTVLIGPEAGLPESDKTAAENLGFQEIRLGPRILRTETAGPAILAALLTRWGDMG